MAEVTIPVPDDCIISGYAAREARRHLLWNALDDEIQRHGEELHDMLERKGPDDQRPDELRAAGERYVTSAEKVKALADELATAQAS